MNRVARSDIVSSASLISAKSGVVDARQLKKKYCTEPDYVHNWKRKKGRG